MAETRPETLLDIRGLKTWFATDDGLVRAVDGVDLHIDRGETLGVVGESGCGKSTLIRAIMGILPRGARVEKGEIWFEGENLLVFSEDELNRDVRSSRIGFIPQDPLLALNPVFKVGTQLLEVMRWHAPDDGSRGAERRKRHIGRLVGLLQRMQVPDPETALERYPHQFSGGQRQRICIARALAMEPELLIADEAVSALDVSVQKQVLELLDEIRQRLNLAVLFITHDLRVAAQICDYVAVMSKGRVVEYGSAEQVFGSPRDDYTKALFAAAPGRNWEFGKFAAAQ
jgi:ABC-type dipeptide/oligopeptide/nickel transport system ATPase component